MRRFIALLALCGCTEYDVVPQPPEYSTTVPPTYDPGVVTDRWYQHAQPIVDVLFVVDNSGSMGEEQSALSANFPVFMQYMTGSGLDYHIGVVSTDMATSWQAGLLRTGNGTNTITPLTPDPSGTMSGMLDSLGTWGSGDERGRDAAWTAVENVALNPGFYRPYARALHIVFVSDENDSSHIVSNGEFLQWMSAQGPVVTAHAIVGLPGDCETSMVGYKYMSYVSATGGVLWDICEPDWAPVMEQMGLQVAGLPREFFLSGHPRPGTLDVTVTWQTSDGPVTAGRSVCEAGYETESCQVVHNRSRNSIVFGTAPFQHDIIRATYEDAAGL